MSTNLISHLPRVHVSAPSRFETIKRNLKDSKTWEYLIPTIGCVALGIIKVPNFSLGLAAGTVLYLVSYTSVFLLKAAGLYHEDKQSKYIQELRKNAFIGSLACPIIEEFIFRAGVQPLAAHCIQRLIPATAGSFMGTNLSLALTISMVVTASFFGLAHYTNNHKNLHLQAGIATIGGISFGVLAAKFGIGASIAAHIANNTIAITHLMLNWKEPALKEKRIKKALILA